MVDEADWVNALRSDFDPEISIAIAEYRVGALTVYAVAVDEARHKPVICKKNRSKLVTDKKGKQKDVAIVQESAVYYRYAGQTKAIGYADFRNMLAERDATYLRKLMETLQVVQKVGVANAGVMDMSAPKSSIHMSKETAKGLNLIDKANLVEEKGAPLTSSWATSTSTKSFTRRLRTRTRTYPPRPPNCSRRSWPKSMAQTLRPSTLPK
jgi:hypothetical protein